MKFLISILVLLSFHVTVAQQQKNSEAYRLIAYNNGNQSVKSVSNTVQIKKKLQLYVPNAFTPDGDNVNDLFGIEEQGIDEFSMEIFNRWGELVYSTDDLNKKWDGKDNGKECKQDAYVYVIQAKGEGDIAYTTLRGSVTLLR